MVRGSTQVAGLPNSIMSSTYFHLFGTPCRSNVADHAHGEENNWSHFGALGHAARGVGPYQRCLLPRAHTASGRSGSLLSKVTVRDTHSCRVNAASPLLRPLVKCYAEVYTPIPKLRRHLSVMRLRVGPATIHRSCMLWQWRTAANPGDFALYVKSYKRVDAAITRNFGKYKGHSAKHQKVSTNNLVFNRQIYKF